MQRAKELAARGKGDIRLKESREKLGGPGVSDEAFLLRYIMKGEQETAAMHAAGPPKQYFSTAMPLPTLIQELGKQTGRACLCPGAAGRRFVQNQASG